MLRVPYELFRPSGVVRVHDGVATYTSPHLSSLRERITIDGEPIDEGAIVEAADRVRAAGGDDLTFFEQITAIAMLAIADARVDITVLEVGLGGRLDATNVVDAAVAVVTGVALDHESILGTTLAAIAGEKAGIFKRGRCAVVGASGEDAAVPALIAVAAAVGATLTRVDEASVAAVPPLALAGHHQRKNAAAALAAVDQLAQLGVLQVDEAARAHALATVVHPGRFEIIRDVILDGAHNPHGATALAAVLRERGLRPTLILAISADKDARAIVAALAPEVSRVIATRYQQDRALPPGRLAEIVADLGSLVDTAPDLAAALALASVHGGPVLVAGSLFLVGEARVLLLGAARDPIVVSDPPGTESSFATFDP